MRQAGKRLPGAVLAGALLWMGIVLAACEAGTPTPPPTSTLPRTVAPSPTVNPVLPTLDPQAAIGVNDATAAAVPNQGNTEGFVPLPPEEPFEVTASSDGLELRGTLYRAAEEPTPAVLLLHMLGGERRDWLPLVTPLQQTGYTVLAVDLRGHGATGGGQDWELARQDTLDMLAALRQVDGVDPARVGVIGASIGANLALVGCAADAACRTAVLLSPGLDYRGVTTAGAVTQLGERPLLIVASEEDSYAAESSQELDSLAAGPHQLVMLSGAGHGTRMFGPQPDLVDTILAWLARTL